jgi:hypothetical protein
MSALARMRTASLAAMSIAIAAGCTSILGVTDVPNGPSNKDAATSDADTDSGETSSTSEASADAAPMCVAGNADCPTIKDPMTGTPYSTGAGCCSSFCISNAVGGNCGVTAGTYTVKVNGKPATGINVILSMQSTLSLSFKLASGADAGITLTLNQVATGCTINHIEMFTTIDDYKDDGTAGCGLTVNSIAPQTIQATFSGTLTGLTQQMVYVSVSQPLK